MRSLADALESAGGSASIGTKFDVLLEYCSPLLEQQHDNWPQRREDLEALREIASRYRAVQDFLADLAIDPPESEPRAVRAGASEAEDERPLTLSTIHSAKGLEWDEVYLLGVADGSLPDARSMGNEEELEEERRLLYVAVTRARRQLALTWHHSTRHRFGQLATLSRFLTEGPVAAALSEAEVEVQPEAEAPTTAVAEPRFSKARLLAKLNSY